MTLTKADIIEAVQIAIGFTSNQSIDIVESILESGEDALVFGFGKFCVTEKCKRRERNPATGEDMMLSPRKVVTFKCSGNLRRRIDGN